MKQRKRRRPATITTAQAMAKLRAILPLVEKDTIWALRIETTLEAGNDRIGALKNKSIPGALAYNTLRRSLAFDLAMHLARIFDQGARRVRFNKRDTASIPIMARLLGQTRCQKALKRSARDWMNGQMADLWERDCTKGIEGALAAYKALRADPFGRQSQRSLKAVRDNHLAHSLLTGADFDVVYNHLYRLSRCAAEFVDQAQLAIEGKSPVMDQRKANFRNEADEFWAFAIAEPPDDDNSPISVTS